MCIYIYIYMLDHEGFLSLAVGCSRSFQGMGATSDAFPALDATNRNSGNRFRP